MVWIIVGAVYMAIALFLAFMVIKEQEFGGTHRRGIGVWMMSLLLSGIALEFIGAFTK